MSNRDTDGAKENARTPRPYRVRIVAFLFMVVLGPMLPQTWEPWNQPSKAEIVAFFAGTFGWGWVFWTVVNAL